MKTDQQFLEEAARLARKGRGWVEPNPQVGALLVRGGKIMARGWHGIYGGPHAEIAALRKAGETARGASLYVTLEPCSSAGKTPPCTEALQRAGVKKVVVGAQDPDPRHRGAGFALLKKAGISVESLEHPACMALLEPFQAALTRKRPYVILKWAMTLDGRIAARDGTSQWISGEKSRQAVHRLRGHIDGILVGSRTVTVDDPRLNCRKKRAPLVPARIVLDPALSVPVSAGLFTLGGGGSDAEGYRSGPVKILCGSGADREKVRAIERTGAEVVRLDTPVNAGHAFLEEALARLKTMGIHRLLVEGGSYTFTGLIEAGLADQVEAYIAPRIVGGREAPSPVEGQGRAPMREAIQLVEVSTHRSGPDLLMRGFFSCPPSS